MRRRGAIVLLLALVGAVLDAPVPAAGETPAPDGYRVVYRDNSTPGVEHMRLVRDDGPLVVNVARVSPEAVPRIRAVVSNEQVAGAAPTLERASDICRRVGCAFAINADFANLRSGEPVGAVVATGQLRRSPTPAHQHFIIDAEGRASGGPLIWSAYVGESSDGPVGIDGVNVPRHEDQVVLYTPSWAPSTGTNGIGVEIVLRVSGADGPAPLGSALGLEPVSMVAGGAEIPPWGVVLSGRGRGAASLRDLWARWESGDLAGRLRLHLYADGYPVEAVGATPVLLRDRAPVPMPASSFVNARHPRTLAGQTEDGTVLLVTVDGRQPGHSVGMSLHEAQVLMFALGAVTAVNLDGGGSTTFVAHGVMVNHASNQLVFRKGRHEMVSQPRRGDIVVAHIERPVTTALVVLAG